MLNLKAPNGIYKFTATEKGDDAVQEIRRGLRRELERQERAIAEADVATLEYAYHNRVRDQVLADLERWGVKVDFTSALLR